MALVLSQYMRAGVELSNSFLESEESKESKESDEEEGKVIRTWAE
jgi:hypothetical protein